MNIFERGWGWYKSKYRASPVWTIILTILIIVTMTILVVLAIAAIAFVIYMIFRIINRYKKMKYNFEFTDYIKEKYNNNTMERDDAIVAVKKFIDGFEKDKSEYNKVIKILKRVPL